MAKCRILKNEETVVRSGTIQCTDVIYFLKVMKSTYFNKCTRITAFL